jgi:7-cyano-7-deazaguanine reductase
LPPARPVLGQRIFGPIKASQLDTWSAPPGDNVITITGEPSELSALCPAIEAEQPDYYTFQIRYRPGPRIVEGKALKLYLLGFRNRRIGVEDLAAEIRDALVTALDPQALTVDLHQNVRGGHRISASARHNGGVPRDI